MDKSKTLAYIDRIWDESILDTLMEYIKIPNKSPQFDKNWRENAYMHRAVELIKNWCEANAAKNMLLEVIELDNRTPLIFIEIPGSTEDSILLYGHLDKQPEMTGWDEGLSPWTPVLRGEKLFGRGAADDGYAVFASLSAIKLLQEQNIAHPRCIIMIEASEESGSNDLPYYVNALESRIGKPSLVICLDSGCGNYKQLWTTTSLRGLLSAEISIGVLEHGIHSGMGSGIVPSCFQILRQLLSRIENQSTGDILLEDLFVEIPNERIDQANQAAEVLGKTIFSDLPFKKGAGARPGSATDLLLDRTWRPALSLIGLDGVPSISNAGNVTLPELKAKISIRLPPTCDPENAASLLKKTIEADPPFNAQVQCHIQECAKGWDAPKEASWLNQLINEASINYFNHPCVYIGEGGSIPFMGMLGEKFPEAQFFITGVLGPESNAHGPNEFLHIPMAKKLTACVAHIIGNFNNTTRP